jgi:hypothetical protein
VNCNGRVFIKESEAVRRPAVGCIAFHEKAFKLKMKFILFWWAALWIGLPCGLGVVVQV